MNLQNSHFKLIIFSLLFLLMTGCKTEIKLKDGWSEATEIVGDETFDAVFPDLNNGRAIVVDNLGQVHLVYRGRKVSAHNAYPWEIYYTRIIPIQDKMRVEKSKIITIEEHSDDPQSPSIACDGSGRVQIVWTDKVEGNSVIFTRLSNDNGTTWEMCYYHPQTKDAIYPSNIFDSQGNTHIVYKKGRESIGYYRLDPNSHYTANTTLFTNWLYRSHYPSVAVDLNNQVHAVWSYPTGYSAYVQVGYWRSTNGGDSWYWVRTLRGYGAFSPEALISIVTDVQNGLHVVWSIGNNICYIRSTDGGVTWDTSITIEIGIKPSLASYGENQLHLVFERDGAIYYTYSLDRGKTWTPSLRISDEGVNTAYSPFIAVDDKGRKHIVWNQYVKKQSYSYRDKYSAIFYKLGR